MNKILLVSALFLGAFSSYAQTSSSESPTEGRVQTSFPEVKTVEGNEMKWSAGLTSGISSPDGPTASSAEYGLVIGMQPSAQIGTGIEAASTRLDNQSNPVEQTNVLLRGAYTMGGDVPVIKNTYIGAGVGAIFLTGNKVRFAGAPIVGFDIPLSSKMHDYLSLGLEAKYLFVSSNNSPDLFSSNLAIKYWF